jgi:peptidoglycan/LPS O-acetylase OafA/YrhL
MDQPLTINQRGVLSLHDTRFALLAFLIGLLCSFFAGALELPLLERVGIACNPIAFALLMTAYWRASVSTNGADATPTEARRRPLPVLYKLALGVYLVGWIAFHSLSDQSEFVQNCSIVALLLTTWSMVAWLIRLVDPPLQTVNRE